MSNKSNQNIRKVIGTSERPRVAVFRSNRSILAQVIDDTKGSTIVAMSTNSIKESKKPQEKAFTLGMELAKLAKSKKISGMVYDRRNYRYHGQVRALAEGLREGGIKI